jgi:glycosyltransferase involved in cell wall biosynthesis
LDPPETLLVVPCFNEARRLPTAELLALLAAEPRLSLLFVDDGSTDGTPRVLHEVCARAPGRAGVLALPRNVGKGEAVRLGLRTALALDRPGTLTRKPSVVGYVDADLATPAPEVTRLLALFRAGPAEALLASRVLLLGRAIERRAVRHYLGRVFASAASLALRLPVYDTQCGAKLFRPGAAFEAALEEPFLSRWAFDVELLGRLLAGRPGVAGLAPAQVVEEPLLAWRDVPGTKLRPRDVVRAALDMARIARDLGRRRNP